MEIAMFVESYEPLMGSKRRQILVVPHDGNVRLYSRVTDGSKGPHNKWEETTLDTLVGQISNDERPTRKPVGVYVTTADARAISEKGYSPVLGTKACQAHTKAGLPITEAPVVDILCELYDDVLNKDYSLEDSIIDNRKAAGSTVPLAQTQAPTQTFAPAAATPAPTPETNVTSATTDVIDSNTYRVALASVPRKELAAKYVNRMIWGIQDFDIYDYARANGENVLVYGPTGPGKTSSVEAWCAARSLRLATVSGNATLEPSQFFGKTTLINGVWVWVDGPVTDVVRNGGVLLLDELNFINPKIYTTLYTLLAGQRSITLLDHMGETVEAHKDLTVFATMNPDYAGTTPLNFAMRNRFDIQLPWDYDDKVESKLVESKNLLALAKSLRVEAAKGQYETPISTNMLIEFCKFIKTLGYEFAVENFIAHFHYDEQPSVRLVFQTHESNIKDDFGIEYVIEQDNGVDGKSVEEELMEWAKTSQISNI